MLWIILYSAVSIILLILMASMKGQAKKLNFTYFLLSYGIIGLTGFFNHFSIEENIQALLILTISPILVPPLLFFADAYIRYSRNKTDTESQAEIIRNAAGLHFMTIAYVILALIFWMARI